MIDGPLRGEMREEEKPHFVLLMMPRWAPYESHIETRPRRGEEIAYEWSWSLREWCMVY